jgi:hypothetical protein
MERMAESIMNVATTLPEGVPLAAKGLLHLGSRAAVDQTLSRLAARGELIRAGRGIYMRPVQTRFGPRSPSAEQAIEALAVQRGETIVPSGAAAANALGLTTQVPVKSVYLTSGTKPCAEPWPASGRTASCAALAVGPWEQDLGPGRPCAGMARAG